MNHAAPIVDTPEPQQEGAAARAHRVLERMIVTLELAPATITTEGALIERLAVGRTPVREAIQRLAWDGLIEVRPRSGLAIAPLRASDWALVVDARRGVESVLARSAARNASAAAREKLHSAAHEMSKAVLARDALAFLVADKLLDEVIAEASDNEYAVRVAAPLQTHSRRFWYRYQADSGLAQSAEHHVGLIKAILDGNEHRAASEAHRLMAMLSQLAHQAGRR